MIRPVASCLTGRYAGSREESGVLCFRGIRYADAPRFRAPVPVPCSEEEKDASAFGPTAIQSLLHSEPASANPDMKEDCLTVNVWTRSLPEEGKNEGCPVMFWIHGGSYGWGGTVDPLYDCQYLAAADRAPVVVSVEYRVNVLGFSDLTCLPEGKKWKHADVAQSGFLGLLDCQEALRWVRRNIACFGGDPENITIFGESAGGGMVSLLMTSDGSFDGDGRCLFRRVIAQSGTVNLSSDLAGLRENGQIPLVMKALAESGVWDGDPRMAGRTAENLEEKLALMTLDDLMEVSAEDLRLALNADSGAVSVEGSTTVGGLNSFPLRCSEYTEEDGSVTRVRSVIPADPYEALERAAKAGVELMIGTNGDEYRYWINDLGNRDLREEDPEGLKKRVHNFFEYLSGACASLMDKAFAAGAEDGEEDQEFPEWLLEMAGGELPETEDPEEIKQFLADGFLRAWCKAYDASLQEGKTPCRDDGRFPEEEKCLWQHTELASQLAFRMPSVLFAESFLKAGGKVWMYYFDRKADMKVIGTLMGACHACEVAYCLNNVPHGEMYSGKTDPDLARRMSAMWVSFAAEGLPACEGFTALPWDTEKRSTVCFADDCSISNVSDPLSSIRLFLEPFADAWRLM